MPHPKRLGGLRVALVSPYSWTYPGGVNGHVAALARELRRMGDDVSVLAPSDPPDRISRVLHAGRAVASSLLGMPALLREGLTWSDIRLEALRAVELAPRDDRVSAPRSG
jgi:glycosyl transferase family 4